jgi:hypothetical protein
VGKLSQADKKLIEEAGAAVIRGVEEDISAAVEQLKGESDALAKVPSDVLRAYLDRSVTADPEFQALWNDRQNHADVVKTKISFAGRALDSALNSLHGDGQSADDGVADEGVQRVVARLEQAANLPSSFPSSIVETLLLDASKSNPDLANAWDSRTADPASWAMHENGLSHNLRQLAHVLSVSTRPSVDELTLPDGNKLSPVDMYQMSDADFAKLTKSLKARTEKAKAKAGAKRK